MDYIDFCNAVYGKRGMTNRVPDGVKPEDSILKALRSLPEGPDFLKLNLDEVEFPEKEREALKTAQCAEIRRLRNEAYKLESDGMYMGFRGDGDSEERWLESRKAIKGRYPWPGKYR